MSLIRESRVVHADSREEASLHPWKPTRRPELICTFGGTASFPLGFPFTAAPPVFLAAVPLLPTALDLLVFGAFLVVVVVVFMGGFVAPFGAGLTGDEAFLGGILVHPICISNA